MLVYPAWGDLSTEAAMAKHKRMKQITDMERFFKDAHAISIIYSRYGFELQTNGSHYKAVRKAENALWDLVREVTGKDEMPWARGPLYISPSGDPQPF